ncbi:MAG: recombination mediator RecR [Candidatus Melainabacteria bacterium]|nr:recombination mediator RecR [Candidatus Melainabacteria bacterium]
MSLTPPLASMVEAFQKLPGVGPKLAQRLAFHMLRQPNDFMDGFVQALLHAREQVHPCPVCFNLSGQSPCEICVNPHRQRQALCVVADPRDLLAVEKARTFSGLYHVLGGLISPLDGIGPEQLKIRELIRRLNPSLDETLSQQLPAGNDYPAVTEVILALPPSTEGDTTSLYLTRLLKPLEVTVSRIAFGLPVGGDLEYADSLTLSRALAGRQTL